MRSTDERMSEVLGRARMREVETRRRRKRAAALCGGALSIVIVVAVGIGVASANLSGAPASSGPFGLMGNVFSDSSALGYVVVGVLGLVLGAAVTALAYRLGGAHRTDAPDEKGVSNDEGCQP